MTELNESVDYALQDLSDRFWQIPETMRTIACHSLVSDRVYEIISEKAEDPDSFSILVMDSLHPAVIHALNGDQLHREFMKAQAAGDIN